jgi:hypothetical protein
MKSLRRITSLVMVIDFLIMTGTFVVLYIEPHGRTANWADWRLLGLSKEQWGALHTNLGTLFLVAMILHIYLNWKPIVTYLKNKKKEVTMVNKDSVIALLITLFVAFGTYFEIPPFSTFLGVSSNIKEEAAKKYGDPPYGHAELSTLKTFVKKVNLDLKKSQALLQENGITVNDIDKTLLDIADENNISPQDIYEMIKAAKVVNTKTGLPDVQPDGLGRRVLADLCQEYNLMIKKVVKILKDNGIDAKEDQTLKQIAEGHDGITPGNIYEVIKTNYPSE